VAERRWNLHMKSGIDVMLPEGEFRPAIEELGKLEAEHQILSRDIRLIDFRLADRVTIQLSDEAAERRRAAAEAGAKARAKAKRKSG
jgi:cell division protein FtsQ